MADEAAIQQAQTDYEKQMAELKARAEKAEQEARAARDAGQAWEQKYQSDMQQVRDWAQQVQAAYQAQVQQAQAKPAAEPENDEAIATTKTVKDAIAAMQQSMTHQVAQTLGQQQIAIWREARMRNRSAALADSRLEGIAEMIGDIDRLLDNVHPQGAASEDAYRQAYSVILGQRQMAAREEAARQAASAPPADDGDDIPATPAPAAVTPAAAPPRPAAGHFGAMPAPTAMAASGGRGQARREPEDEFEAHVIQRHYGGDRKAYLRDLQITKSKAIAADPYDVMDAKGRSKF